MQCLPSYATPANINYRKFWQPTYIIGEKKTNKWKKEETQIFSYSIWFGLSWSVVVVIVVALLSTNLSIMKYNNQL